MPYPQHGQGKSFTGPPKATGFPGKSHETIPPPQSLQDFEQLMVKKSSFSDDNVMKLAASLGSDLAKTFEGRKGEGGTTQVRKIYGEVRALQKKAEDTIRPEIRLIQAHVAYAVGRKTLPGPFKKFADLAAERLLVSEAIKDEINRFVKFFEAMYAHFYYTSKMEG